MTHYAGCASREDWGTDMMCNCPASWEVEDKDIEEITHEELGEGWEDDYPMEGEVTI